MPTIKITRKSIADLHPAEKPVTYFDSTLPGFGLKIQPTGARSWILEYRPGAGGRAVAKKRMKIGSFATHTPEQAREAKTLARVTLGGDPAAARAEERASLTVAELSSLFLANHVKLKRKARTYDEYKSAVDRYIVPVLGSIRGSLVTPADVARLQAHITRGKTAKGNGGRTMANRTLAVLSAMYGWAGKQGLVALGTNPSVPIERFKERRMERFLTSVEIGALGQALSEAETIGLPYDVDTTKAKAKHAPKAENRLTVYSPHAIAAVRLFLLTGMRRREILDLRWSQVDLERGVLFLPDSKTGAKTVVLSAPALVVIEGLDRVGSYVIAGDSAGTDNEKPRSDLAKPWRAVLKRAGLEKVRLHDLRHSFASVGVGGSLGLPIVGKLLGHSKAATTERYAHLDIEPLRRAADAIGDRISKAMESHSGKTSE
jgi:integrase